jgi:hypothetical protein
LNFDKEVNMGFIKTFIDWITERPVPSKPAAPRNPYTARLPGDDPTIKEIVETVRMLNDRMVDLDCRMTHLEGNTQRDARPMDIGTRHTNRERVRIESKPPIQTNPESPLSALEYLKQFGQECKELIACLTNSRTEARQAIKFEVDDKIEAFEANLRDLDQYHLRGSSAHQELNRLVSKKTPIDDLAIHLLKLAQTDLRSADAQQKEALRKAIENFAFFMKLRIIKPAMGEIFNDALHQVFENKSGGGSMRGKIAAIHFWGYQREDNGQCIKKAEICMWD